MAVGACEHSWRTTMGDLKNRWTSLESIEPPDLWQEAERRQPRDSIPGAPSRPQKFVVILTAFAVAIAGTLLLVQAFAQQGPKVGSEPDAWTSYDLERIGLTIDYPVAWRIQPFDEYVGHLGMSGVIVTNTSIEFHHPDLDPNEYTSDWDMRGLPQNGVVLSIERMEGGLMISPPKPDSSFPLSFDRQLSLAPSPPGAGEPSTLWRPFTFGGQSMGLRAWLGSESSDEDQAILDRIVASIRPTTAESTTATPSNAPTDASDASPTLQIRCDGTGTDVLTPVVAAQSDGVHIAFAQAGAQSGVSLFPPARVDGVVGVGVPRDAESTVVDIPVGAARITCGYPGPDQDPTSRDELRQSQPFTLVDPEGLWHDDILDCAPAEQVFPESPALSVWAEGNPVQSDPAAVLPRVIPGILPTDAVDYAGYPQGEHHESRWRVVRDGRVVALVPSPFNQTGRLHLSPVEACGDAGIGTRGAATTGLTAAPFSVDGTPNCDPYSAECELVYVSADRYTAMGGVGRTDVDFGNDLVVCIQDWLMSVDCAGQPGGTFFVALRMSPADALAFRERYSCGGSLAELCV
jgi:hypothetical protein